MNLSPHFTLAEATVSQTAARRGVKNDPPIEMYQTLKNTAACMERVRELLGHPISVSSWYRSPLVNMYVGGSSTSQHMSGEAVDFICPAFGDVDKIVATIMASDIEFDQLIKEHDSWVHISFGSKNRRQVLVIDQLGTRNYA